MGAPHALERGNSDDHCGSPLRAGKILAQETQVVRNMFENVNEQKDVRADELRWWGVLDKSQGTVVFDALARIVRVDTESALT